VQLPRSRLLWWVDAGIGRAAEVLEGTFAADTMRLSTATLSISAGTCADSERRLAAVTVVTAPGRAGTQS
jgi:hypothetical protein